MASDLKRAWRNLRSHFECVPIALGRAIIPRLSRRGVLRLVRGIAAVAAVVDRHGRKMALANLDLVFPGLSPLRRRAILTGCYRNIIRVMLDMFWFDRDSAARVARWTSLSPVWKQNLDRPCPKIIVTAHHGNWEMAGHVVVSNGYPLISVSKPVGGEATTRKMLAFRTRLGQKIVMADGAVLPLLRTLKKGGNIALVADQHLKASQGGIWSNFLGHPALTAPTPAFFAGRVPGAFIGVAYMQARPNGSYRCITPVIIEPCPGESIPALTQRISDATSALIRRFPTQWLWAYARWNDVPEGDDPSRYPYYASE